VLLADNVGNLRGKRGFERSEVAFLEHIWCSVEEAPRDSPTNMVVKPIVDQGSKVRPETDVIETTTDHNAIRVGLVGNAIDAVLVLRTDLHPRYSAVTRMQRSPV
jgi:hypothetical protein